MYTKFAWKHAKLQIEISPGQVHVKYALMASNYCFVPAKFLYLIFSSAGATM
jgi:hypothetical protein